MTTRRRPAALCLALLLLTGVACGSDDDSSETGSAASDQPGSTEPAPAPSTSSAGSAAGSRAAVLDEPGAQPRQPLTLKVAAGTRTRTAMVSKIGLKLSVDNTAVPEEPTPATRTVLEQRVDRVDPDGTIHYSVTVAEVTVVSTPGVDPALVRQVQAALDQMKGITGTGSLDASGDVKDVTFNTSGVTDPTVRSTLDSMSSQVGNLAAPFPKEPVGAGARWTVKRRATISGLVMDTTTRYTLRSRAGDRYELDFTQEAVSPPGPVDLPNIPAGGQASIVSFSLQTRGQVSGDLTKPVPERSSSTGTGDGSFAVSAGGQRSTLRQQMTLELTTSPA